MNFDGVAPSILGYGKIGFIANLLGGIFFALDVECAFSLCAIGYMLHRDHPWMMVPPVPMLLIYHHILMVSLLYVFVKLVIFIDYYFFVNPRRPFF